MRDTISDTRRDLTGHVARFRAEGSEAEPVVFGDHRRAEAVLVPFETYEFLVDVAEEVATAHRIEQRLTDDNGARTSLREVAAQLGVDLDAL